MSEYQERLYTMLENNIEPDCEDYYLAEIEGKANKYDDLQRKFKATNKGLIKVINSRKVWKNRYYREKKKRKQLIEYLEDKIIQCDKNIEETTKWLNVEEVHSSAKNDLHLAKVVKINYEKLLEKVKSGKYE